MYRIINIDGNEYKLEYTIEASLYGDCVANISSFMLDMQQAKEESDVKKMLNGVSNLPQTTLAIFYAGLLEYHGDHSGGDKKVPNIDAAKRLIAKYMKEHKEDGTGNFYSIMQICMEQMGEDGFFDLIGLDAMTESKQQEIEKLELSGK